MVSLSGFRVWLNRDECSSKYGGIRGERALHSITVDGA